MVVRRWACCGLQRCAEGDGGGNNSHPPTPIPYFIWPVLTLPKFALDYRFFRYNWGVRYNFGAAVWWIREINRCCLRILVPWYDKYEISRGANYDFWRSNIMKYEKSTSDHYHFGHSNIKSSRHEQVLITSFGAMTISMRHTQVFIRILTTRQCDVARYSFAFPVHQIHRFGFVYSDLMLNFITSSLSVWDIYYK